MPLARGGVVARRKHAGRWAIHVEIWERQMTLNVARAFRADQEELQAELASRLCELKSRNLRGIRNWKAYVTKFLYNKASNIVRSWRLREKKEQAYEAPHDIASHDEVALVREPVEQFEDNRGLALDLASVWSALDPDQQRFWKVLLQERGNQTRTAKRLGKHRNTVILWKKQIRAILEHHGVSLP
ncbi:MAG: hypothetical protein ACR2JB_15880 [Bryobacteraceae bacterium]